METTDAIRLLVFSGGLSILFASLLGAAMLIPLQPWGQHFAKGMNFRQLMAAHLDWIMLGLMQGLAAMLIFTFALAPSALVVWAMVIGGWMNPLPYLFRAFGINAFALSGPPLQRIAAALGGISSTLILIAWTLLLLSAWRHWN
jgi:hypothetical protein